MIILVLQIQDVKFYAPKCLFDEEEGHAHKT
jgi:hypothetical protein